MKITRKQIRRIVVEERRRITRGKRYDDELLNEGILDFLKGMWEKASGFFFSSVEKAKEKFMEFIHTATDKNVSSSSGEEGGRARSASDLKPEKNEKDRVTLLKSIAPAQVKTFLEAEKQLKSTGSVKNWNPKSDSKDDLKAWMKENKESSKGLWDAVGAAKAAVDHLFESGVRVEETEIPKKNMNPGEAIKFFLASCKSLKKVWESATKMNLENESKEVLAAISKAEAAATAVGKSIAEAAKKQQNEWVLVHRLVRAHLIQENYNRRTSFK